MGRARQIASSENMDRILLDASAASTDVGEHLLEENGFFINTEIGTTETPPEGFVISSSIAADAIDNTKLADDAVQTENIADDAGAAAAHRNVVINGAFNINQRTTHNDLTGLGAANVYVVDRFEIDVNTAARLTATTPAVTDLPGFTKCLKLDCTTADTSVASGDLFMLRTTFEGQDVQHFKKGTSEAQGWVLSYYIKVDGGPFTGTAELNDSQNNRHVNANFTATNTWQRVSHFFPADSSGTLDNDETDTLRINWHFMAGSTYSGGSIQSAWASRSNTNTAPGTDNFFGSTDNNIYLTGVQLEAGDALTEFEREPPQISLKKCQRYFEVGFSQIYGGSPNATAYAPELQCPYNFKVTKRSIPTITTHNSGSTRGSIAVGPNIKTDGFSMQLDVTDASTPVAGGNFDFDAESDF